MEAPSEYKTAGILMVVASGLTLLWSLIGVATLVLSFIGICFAPYYLLPIGLAIFEMVGGVAAASGKPNSSVKLSAISGLIAAFLCCNFIGVVLEIVALVFLSNSEVSDFLEGT